MRLGFVEGAFMLALEERQCPKFVGKGAPLPAIWLFTPTAHASVTLPGDGEAIRLQGPKQADA